MGEYKDKHLLFLWIMSNILILYVNTITFSFCFPFYYVACIKKTTYIIPY